MRGCVLGPAIAAGALLFVAALVGLLSGASAAGPRPEPRTESAAVRHAETAAGTRAGAPAGTRAEGRAGTFGEPIGDGAVEWPVGGAAPVRDGGESIPTYDVMLTIQRDGVLRVRETITYDFGAGGEHGIVRHVPFRQSDRLYDIRDVSTSSSTGAPARARTLKLFHDVQISVGDRHRTVRGRQAYVIEYEVLWVFTPYRDHDLLVWDAIGANWDVPIGDAAVRVEAPVPLRNVSCRSGAGTETTKCLRDRDGPYAIDFTQSGLRPREGMTVRVRLPKGAIAVPPPRYAPPRWTGTWPGTAALAVALGAVALAARRPAAPRGAGAFLTVLGALLIAADAAGDVLTSGLWAFSLGDESLAGLAFMIVGVALGCARRAGPPQLAAGGGQEEYSWSVAGRTDHPRRPSI